MNENTYQVSPIGHIRATSAGFELHILEPFRPALKELRRFSHVKVLWWADRLDNEQGRSVLQCELPYAKGQQAGVFACCSPARPNPIALDTCSIMGVDEKKGIVTVPWIDAFDGTPILDLKPYIPIADRVREFYVPDWLAVLPEWVEDADQIPPGFFEG
jgi:tRNA-Thr(GGU) m(6)t(6)A37 methyltransferase TsaA